MEIIALIAGFFAVPVLLGFASFLNLYLVIPEQQCCVFTLFGRVVGKLDEPGLNFPMGKLGPKALLVPFFGKSYWVDLALRQSYLRSQMVNSEEGTPMGMGIWYEMRVSDPVKYLFVNANPEESLRANVANATVSTLSNLEMEKMLEDRHSLSRTVRNFVSPQSEKWGYALGSVYIRKVAFTDVQMVRDITAKVVKRLVQVTSAMRQDGENRVGLIKAQTARAVSEEMAKALSRRPEVVGGALNEIGNREPEVLRAVLEVLEFEKLVAAKPDVVLLPSDTTAMLNLNIPEGRHHEPPKTAHHAGGDHSEPPALRVTGERWLIDGER